MESLYSDCKTGEECHRRFLYLQELESKDLDQTREAYKNWCIHKLMDHYKMPYKCAAQEFYSYGMNHMGWGI